MAFSISPIVSKDGNANPIPGGVDFVDTSGTGAGPWIIAKSTIDPAGINVQFVLANNAAKCDISSVNGTTTATGHGTASGAIRVELPTDGTGLVNAAQSGAWNVGQSGTWTVQQGTPPWSVSQSGNWTSRIVGNAGGIMDAAGQNASAPANELLVAGQFNTSPTAITSGNVSPLQLDGNGNLRVNLNANSFGTVTVAGIVTANAGTNLNTSALALDTSVNGILVSQGSTTSGEKGPLIQGAVTTAAPSYTTAQTSPLSLDTSGNLRITGTVTANAGTNLNTSALALDTSVNGILVTQGSTTSGEKGPLIQGAVTASAPSYTTAQTSPLSLDTSGNLRVAGSFSAGAPSDRTATGTVTAVNNAVTVSTQGDGNVGIIVTADTNVTMVPEATVDGTNWVTVNAYPVGGGASVQSIAANGSWTTHVAGLQSFRMRVTAVGATPTATVSLDASQGSTNPNLVVSPTAANFNATVAGTVTANQGGAWTVTANAGTNLNTSALALDTSVNGILVSQGSTTSGEKGPLIQGAVTTNAPAYTTAQTSPLSLDTAGLLRLSWKDTPANTNNLNVNLAASAATVTVTGTVTANQGGAPWTVNPGTAANWGVGNTGAAVPAATNYIGGLAKTALPTAGSDGNLTGVMVDKFGRQVILNATLRDLTGTQATTISASTTETTIVTAGGAGVFNDIVMFIVSNTSAATNTRIDFRDTTAGTILFSLQSNGGQPPVGFALAIPIPQTTANTNWTAQCATSTTDIRVYAVFAKNK